MSNPYSSGAVGKLSKDDMLALCEDGPLAESDQRLRAQLAVAPSAPFKKRRILLPPLDPNGIEAFEQAAAQLDFDRCIAKMVPSEGDPWLL